MTALPLSRSRLYRGWRRFVIAATALAAVMGGKAALDWDRGWYVSINWTESLPYWAFKVDKTREPQVGDFVEFWPPENPYYEGVAFIKRVVAGPGDIVQCEGRAFFVRDVQIALAKEVSQAGDPLTLGPCGTVPDGHFFVVTQHQDSFDSRYGEIGHVPRERVRGVAIPLL